MTQPIPAFALSRRSLLGRAMLVPGGLVLPGCVTAPAPAVDSAATTTIYSPAPATTSLHKLYTQLASASEDFRVLGSLEVLPVALPESINNFANMDPSLRQYHWPIVTTIDLQLARAGTGPDWHGYPRVNSDLKLVCTFTDTAVGISMWGEPVTDPEQLRGKRIAAPPRPSAVRLMTELLLRDGWGILDDVTLVDMMPPAVLPARAAGKVDGTSWNIVGPTPNGHRPSLPSKPDDPLTYVPVGQEAVDRINAANPFDLALSHALEGGPALLSLAQGLAVWDEVDPAKVGAMLEYIEANGASIPGFAANATEMAAWPGLTADMLSPVAKAFYRARGVKIPG